VSPGTGAAVAATIQVETITRKAKRNIKFEENVVAYGRKRDQL
jgi:hypothetical protein